jgi:hypothetical protein
MILEYLLIRWLMEDPCTAIQDLDGFHTGLDYFGDSLHVAESLPVFNRGRARERLQTGRTALRGVLGRWESVSNLCANYEAVVKIQEGLRRLRRIGAVRNNPAEAAHAFGQIFEGLGQFATYLPPPLNAYAQILQNCGTFFTNMRQQIDPNERWRHREDWRIGQGGLGNH